jgi:hypothetical protein
LKPAGSTFKVKYSKDFKKLYEEQDQAIKDRFFVVDSFVIKGDLHGLRRQGWMFFVHLGPSHAAFGSLRDDRPEDGSGKVFYWMFIGSKKNLPVIL